MVQQYRENENQHNDRVANSDIPKASGPPEGINCAAQPLPARQPRNTGHQRYGDLSNPGQFA